jgi:hypothetical protein
MHGPLNVKVAKYFGKIGRDLLVITFSYISCWVASLVKTIITRDILGKKV